MIARDKALRKVCSNYELVENYIQARFDEENVWELHHIYGIKLSRKLLKRIGMYFGRPPRELVFLKKFDHRSLHRKGKKFSDEHRKKISENHADIRGNKHPLYGKHHSEQSRKTISEMTKIRMDTPEVKDKMRKQRIGRHWYNNGIINVWAKECPEGFVRGMLKPTK